MLYNIKDVIDPTEHHIMVFSGIDEPRSSVYAGIYVILASSVNHLPHLVMNAKLHKRIFMNFVFPFT